MPLAAYNGMPISPRLPIKTILASLLVHICVLLLVRGCEPTVEPPPLSLTVELRPETPPPLPAAEPPRPEAAKPPPRVATPPRPAPAPAPHPEPVLTAPPEATPRADTPVIQRAPEPAPAPPPPAPAAPAVAPPPPPVEAVDEAGLLRGFVKSLSAQVAKQKRYPKLAQVRGWQGEAQVRVVVEGPAGKLIDVTLERSSGYESLDREALEMVRRAAPFPLPAGLRRQEVAVVVPVVFRLESP